MKRSKFRCAFLALAGFKTAKELDLEVPPTLLALWIE
jgi:hypothetical protein